MSVLKNGNNKYSERDHLLSYPVLDSTNGILNSSSGSVQGSDCVPKNKSGIQGNKISQSSQRYESRSSEDVVLLKNVTTKSKNVPVTRAAVVLALISVLFSLGSGSSTQLASQFLVWRYANDNPKYRNMSSSTGTDACNKNSSDPNVKKMDEIESEVAIFMMYVSYVRTFTALFSSMIFSTYSDYFGRRLINILPIAAITINQVIQAVIMKFHLPLWLYYVGNGVEGIGGSWYLLLVGQFSLTADITVGATSRVFWITALSSLTNVCASASSITGGYMIQYLGYFPTACLQSACFLAACLLGICLLPETRPQQSTRNLNLFHNLKSLFSFYFFEGALRTKLAYNLLVFIFALSVMPIMNVDAIDTLYMLHKPFCWGSETIGNFRASKQSGQFLISLAFLKVTQICHIKDRYIAQVAMLFQGGQFVLEGLATSSLQLYISPVVGCIGVLTVPMVRGLMSSLAGPHMQGALFGSICVMETVFSLASSSMFNSIYAATVATFPGAVYLAMAGCNMLAFMLFFVYYCVKER